jgi:hypothetical protein
LFTFNARLRAACDIASKFFTAFPMPYVFVWTGIVIKYTSSGGKQSRA